MTTTPNPTEAQLLAGLNAFYRAEHEQANIKRPFIDAINLDDWSPQAIARMRAALVAAQGAARQVESADCDRDRMGICKRCGMGLDARKVLDGDFACPVLPSSGVDEEKLAEVIGRDENYTSDLQLGGWTLSPRLAARAVAEWLKGQGGESRGE